MNKLVKPIVEEKFGPHKSKIIAFIFGLVFLSLGISVIFS